MHIEIEVPRPLLTGVLLVGIVTFATWSVWDSTTLSADLTADTGFVAQEKMEEEEEFEFDSDTAAPENVNTPLQQPAQIPAAIPMPMFYPYMMPPMYPMWGMPGMQGQGPGMWAPQTQDMNAVDEAANEEVSNAERKLREARAEQELLDSKEELLRAQIKALEEQRKKLGSAVSEEIEERFRESTRALVELLQDEQKSERFILDTLNQMRLAQGEAVYLGKGLHGVAGELRLIYPLVDNLGLTAMFHDPDYPYAFDHTGVDLRAPQGSTVLAAADGIVHRVSNKNGNGYNWIMIDHQNGYATLYGHISEALVVEGQPVKAGDEIARSGGMPGTTGAGSFTTGPHLHFEVWLNGEAVDPEEYLPRTVHVKPW